MFESVFNELQAESLSPDANWERAWSTLPDIASAFHECTRVTSSSNSLSASGATLITVTVAVYSLDPPSLSLILPRTVRVPLVLVAQLDVFELPRAPYPEPSPQSKAYWNPAAVSAELGSDGPLSDSATGLPSFTLAGRSEEGGVGKECRARGSAYPL